MARRWVCIAIKKNRTAVSARACLKELAKAAPFRIGTLPTDDGTEFTDRLSGSRARQPRGEHGFDGLYQAPEIKHRQTRPRSFQRNGMVERFDGRLEQVLRSHHFISGQAMKQWHRTHTDLFNGKPVNHPGADKYRRRFDNTVSHRIFENSANRRKGVS